MLDHCMHQRLSVRSGCGSFHGCVPIADVITKLSGKNLSHFGDLRVNADHHAGVHVFQDEEEDHKSVLD